MDMYLTELKQFLQLMPDDEARISWLSKPNTFPLLQRAIGTLADKEGINYISFCVLHDIFSPRQQAEYVLEYLKG